MGFEVVWKSMNMAKSLDSFDFRNETAFELKIWKSVLGRLKTDFRRPLCLKLSTAISAIQYVFADVVQQEGCGVFMFCLYENEESGDDFADEDFLQGAGVGQGAFLQEAADIFG